MKITVDISKKLGVIAKKIIWFLGLHAFLLILFLIFVDFIFGGFVLYKYIFLTEKLKPEITGSILKFNDKAYQKLIVEFQIREQNIENF